MIGAFMGIASALYGGALLAGVAVAVERPDAYRVLTGEDLTKAQLCAAVVVAAVFVAAGYAGLARALGIISDVLSQLAVG